MTDAKLPDPPPGSPVQQHAAMAFARAAASATTVEQMLSAHVRSQPELADPEVIELLIAATEANTRLVQAAVMLGSIR